LRAVQYAFDEDAKVARSHNDQVLTDVSARWNIGDKPNGGYLLALAVRAMAEMVQHPHPLSITGHFLRPGEVGPAEIETDVARVGRTLSTVSAQFVQGGKERLRTIATFGDLNKTVGPTNVTATPPVIAPYEQCLDRRDSPTIPKLAIADMVDIHLDTSRTYAKGDELTVTAWMSLSDGRPFDVWVLPVLLDAGPPTVHGMLAEPTWVPTVELTCHIRALPAPGGRMRAVFRSRNVRQGLFEEDSELWDTNNCLVAQGRQLAMVLPSA
jgi:hypothetical protein